MSEPARARRKPARRRGRADALDQGAQALAAARAATHSAASGLISDEPADVDRLGRDDLSSHIATVIATLPPPFTIAVYGDWGEGKTSLLKHIRDKVRTESDDGGAGACYTVWFDLWQHQDDVNPVLAMLQMARAERDKTNTLLAKAVSKLDAVIPLMWTAMDHLPKVGWGADAGPKVEVSLAGLGSDYQRHRDARREDRMEVLDAQVRLHELFAEVLDTLAGDGRVVFFVDDLDRCLPEHVVDLLEKIRLFMNHKKCVFVLGVDEQAVENAIKEAKDYKDEEIAGRYLEKMIQYGFDLPPVDSAQRDEFVMTALRQAVGDSLSDDQIHTIVTGLWSYAFNDPEVNASV
ncbi:MAG: KAP family NTPase, partial [Micrococcales bacterium]|nr:KAP family NTPase [Micrococcales bacterium]